MAGKSKFNSMTIIAGISIIIGVLLSGGLGYSDDATLSLDIDVVNDSVYTTITMHGLLLASGMPKEGVKIGIHADDADSNHIFASEVTTGVNGEYTTFFKLENKRTGTYKVFASASSTQASGAVAVNYFAVGECSERWVCSVWSACGTDNRQIRTCTDENHCGSENEKPPLSRDCTCALLGGQACSYSQRCDGSFVDASDTEWCCDGICKTISPSSGGTTYPDEPEDEPAPQDENEIVQDIPEVTVPVNDTEADVINETGNVQTSDADLSESLDVVHDDAPTGGLISILAGSRWAIVNTIIIVLILFFAVKLAGTGRGKDDAVKKYSYSPKTQKTGLVRCLSNIGGIVSFSDAAFLRKGHETGYVDNAGVRKLKVVVPEDE